MISTPPVEPAQARRLEFIFLIPGGFLCTHRPSVANAVPGSCVSLCLWDRRRRSAGINHYLLPYGDGEEYNLRYGGYSIGRLIEEMRRMGSRTGDLEAKVFGGAAVIPAGSAGDHAGDKNVKMALECMQAEGIPVVARRSGGHNGLLVRMFTTSGDVLVRPVRTEVASLYTC